MEIRLQKYLADAGIASRRKSEELILAGRISVNGDIVTELGVKVDDKKDKVTFDGNPVSIDSKLVYIMLNKPVGYVTTVKDQFNRPAVVDLLKGVKERVFPVGRLDYDTSGLLLLTNDGDLTFKLTHPKHNVEKTYRAKVFGTPTTIEMSMFRRGLVIEGKKTAPAKISIVESQTKMCVVDISITEGRNRQVRKMCSAIKHPVSTLKRTAIGEIELGDLSVGKFRYLTDKEVKYLKKLWFQ